MRQLGDDFKRRVATGEDREAVIRDLTQQAIGQGVVAPHATPEEVKRVRVQGSNQVISEADFVRIVIRFQQGVDMLTMAHEFGEAWIRLVRQILLLQTTGRITKEVSPPWPERDLSPSGWLGKYHNSLEHSYRMAPGGHWGAEMQATVEQAQASTSRVVAQGSEYIPQ